MISQMWISCRIILMVIISACIGLISLCGVYALPTGGSIFHNAQASAITFEKEGETFSWAYGNISGGLDDYTDSIMIQKAIFPGTGHVLEDALQNPGYDYLQTNPVKALLNELHGETDGHVIANYGRYWHGYLLYLKPLLLWGTVGQIRMLNGMLQLLLTFYMVSLIREKLGRWYPWAFVFTYLSLNPISLAMSFQYSSMYYLMIGISLWILSKKNLLLHPYEYLYVFTAAGIGTAFFDFLTYPLVSYGIPVTLFLLLRNKAGVLMKTWEEIQVTILAGLAWCFGYGGMYLSKWLLSWYFIGYNAFQEAVGQALYRMSDHVVASEVVWPELSCSVGYSILLNVCVMLQNPAIWLLLLFLFLQTVRMYFTKKEKMGGRNTLPIRSALAVVSISPFVWYMVLINHSFLHYWFTFRELSIFIFAMNCYFIVTWQEYDKK